MKNHAYVQISQEPATCEEPGYAEYVCDYCADTKTDMLPASGHNFSEVFNEPATCETPGKITRKCRDCDTEENEDIPQTGHTMEEIGRKESTTSSTGYIIYICANCSKQETIDLPQIITEATEPDTDPAAEPAPVVSDREAYINSCKEGNYEGIARYPEKYKGEKVYFEGYVMSVSESILGNSVTYLIQVTEGDYGIWEDIVYVDYIRSSGDPKILEGDIVTFYGECRGDYTYITVLGNYNTVPYVKAKYIDIH